MPCLKKALPSLATAHTLPSWPALMAWKGTSLGTWIQLIPSGLLPLTPSRNKASPLEATAHTSTSSLSPRVFAVKQKTKKKKKIEKYPKVKVPETYSFLFTAFLTYLERNVNKFCSANLFPWSRSLDATLPGPASPADVVSEPGIEGSQ